MLQPAVSLFGNGFVTFRLALNKLLLNAQFAKNGNIASLGVYLHAYVFMQAWRINVDRFSLLKSFLITLTPISSVQE